MPSQRYKKIRTKECLLAVMKEIEKFVSAPYLDDKQRKRHKYEKKYMQWKNLSVTSHLGTKQSGGSY